MSSIMRARSGLTGRGEVSEVIGLFSRAEGCWTFDARDRMPRPSRAIAHYPVDNPATAMRSPSRAACAPPPERVRSSAHPPPCPPSRRRSPPPADSGHSGLGTGTALHAPFRPLPRGPISGELGWLSALATRVFHRPLSDPRADLRLRLHRSECDG